MPEGKPVFRFFQMALANLTLDVALPLTQKDVVKGYQERPQTPPSPCEEVVVLDGEGRRVDRPPVMKYHPAFAFSERQHQQKKGGNRLSK